MPCAIERAGAIAFISVNVITFFSTVNGVWRSCLSLRMSSFYEFVRVALDKVEKSNCVYQTFCVYNSPSLVV